MKNNLFDKLKMKKVIIGGILFIFWAVLTAVYIYSNSNPTVISKDLPKSVLNKTIFNEVLRGEKILGEFESNQNYLGQISVRFYNFDRINSDEVAFRLKEKGAVDWYYEHIYKTDQFQPNQLFPFGFPIIPDSNGKRYVFEIESVAGKPEDAVTLSHEEPLVSTSYQYPKRLLLKDKNTLFEFSTKKISSVKLNLDFAVSFINYLDMVFLFSLLLYMLLNYVANNGFKIIYLNSSRVIFFGIVLLVFSSIILYLKKYALSETISIASYFLFILGVIIMLIEAKKSKK